MNWAPLASGVPETCDLYIGNRGHRVIGLVAAAPPAVLAAQSRRNICASRATPGGSRGIGRLLVTTGAYHASTIPAWLPRGGREIIPYGILDRFRHAEPREPPPPRAVFTSNPLRGLDWLLDLWVARIKPAVPQAELHIYAGAAVYGGGGKYASAMEAVLARAEALSGQGVRRFAPVGREALIEVLTGARAMLYRGDPGETFCLALGEAQAMGVPAVVQPLGLGRRACRRRRHRPGRRQRRRLCRGGDRGAARRRAVAALASGGAGAAARAELGRGRRALRSLDP